MGDKDHRLDDARVQLRIASAIDELAYEFRSRELLFVVPTGNWVPGDGEQTLVEYPAYLLSDENRLIDPGSSALAVTVGSLSYGEGEPLQRAFTDRGVADRMWPSPFTRRGPGIGGSLKPDFVECGGDLRITRGRVATEPSVNGVPTTSNEFAPPDSRLFRTVAGTSYAAPAVANTIARVRAALPGASSNLVRALLATSSRVPSDRPLQFRDLPTHHDSILNVYGAGRPDATAAIASAPNDVVLAVDDVMELDTVRVYAVPGLPSSFLEARGTGELRVALAFDPPTRHTRRRNYCGVAMQFAMYRNVHVSELVEAVRAWSREEREELEGSDLPGLADLSNRRVELLPGPRRRNNSIPSGRIQDHSYASVAIRRRGFALGGRLSAALGNRCGDTAFCGRRFGTARERGC